MEKLILAVMLASRESFYLIKTYINPKLYSREFQIISGFINDYYDRDNKATVVNRVIIGELITAEVINDKHVEKFLGIIDESLLTDTSEANVKQVILLAKKNEMGVELATAIANGKDHEELVDNYRDILRFSSLDEMTSEGVEVYEGGDVDDLIEHVRNRVGLLRVYPLAFNDRLDGGLSGSDHVVIYARPEMAKCLALGTTVLMADGSTKKVEAISVGEKVAGISGERTVTGTARGQAPMYRISYPWGDSYTVNEDHILSLKRSKVEASHQYGDILNVSVKEYIEWPEGRKQRYKGWKSGQEFSNKELIMDPYLLGCWIGDGSTHKCAVTTIDQEILSAFVEAYGEATTVEKGITYSFGHTDLGKQLRSLGILGKKSIPKEYLTSSRTQRLALLAGLIDTDGTNTGTGYLVCTKEESLKDQYLFLARSLGFHATANQKFAKATNCNHEGAYYWYVYIGAEAYGEVPVRLDRKKGKQSDNPKRKGLQFGIKVEAVGEGKYAGFTLDGDHLFLLEDFTVTHNTALILTMACGFAKQGARGIVFNNEERIERLRMRALCCCTGMTKIEILADPQRAKALAEENGYHNIIFISLSPGTLGQIDSFVDKYQPAWIVVDQIRNLAMKSENRTNQLEAAATGVRNIGKKYNVITISVTQAGDSAEGKAVLEMGDVDNSNCLARGTAVMLADNTTKAIEDILIGEQVMGMDGKPRNVLATGNGVQPMFKITHKGGDSYTVNQSHIMVMKNSDTVTRQGVQPKEIGDLPLQVLLDKPYLSKKLKGVWFSGWEGNHADLPLDPYRMGLWLADGFSHTFSISTSDAQLKNYLVANYENTSVRVVNAANYIVGFDQQSNGIPNPNNLKLKELGVHRNKHIPELYFGSSKNQRLKLLAGLIDGDGSMRRTKDTASDCYTIACGDNPHLAEDVLRLCKSLGFYCTKSYGHPTNENVRLSGKVTEIPTVLDRKKASRDSQIDWLASEITIEKVTDGGEYFGITVDQDERYVLGNGIITHNTGIPGACDVLIGIGATPEQKELGIRVASLCKNKLGGVHENFPMRFNQWLSRYVSINQQGERV